MRIYGLKFLYLPLLSILFLVLACFDINTPYLDWEEAILPSPAIAMITNRDVPPAFTSIQIFGKNFPILEAPWIGAIESYLMFPIFKIFGISIYTLRLTEIALALFIGLLFIYLCCLMFNKQTSYVAGPLILFNTTYLLHGRTGFRGVILVLWMGCVLSLIFFWKWVKLQRNFWLYVSAFIMGLTTYGKLHFLWLAFGIILGWMLVLGPKYGLKLESPNFFKVFLAFIFGFSPYILENILTGGREIRGLIHLFLRPADGSSNSAYFKHLLIRFVQLGKAVGGNNFAYAPLLEGIEIAIAIIFVVILVFSPIRKKIKNPSLFFLLICCVAYILGVAFNGTSLGNEHVYPILPLVFIYIAAMLNTLIKNRSCLIVCVFLILMPHIFIIAKYYRETPKLGDDPIVHVSDYLLTQRFYRPIFVTEYRKAVVIATLTKGKVLPIEAHPDGRLMDRYDEWIKNRENVFIFGKSRVQNDCEEETEGYEIFEQVLKKNMRSFSVIKKFDQKENPLCDSIFVCKVE